MIRQPRVIANTSVWVCTAIGSKIPVCQQVGAFLPEVGHLIDRFEIERRLSSDCAGQFELKGFGHDRQLAERLNTFQKAGLSVVRKPSQIGFDQLEAGRYFVVGSGPVSNSSTTPFVP